MPNIFRNVHYALRQLLHAPEMTLVAVVTLALGIGANTAMFTVAESVLRPLPYNDPAQLVAITNAGPDSGGAVSWLDYRDVQNRSHTLSKIAAYSTDVGVIQLNGSSQSLVSSEVSPNLMRMLGAHPLTGRLFTSEEGRATGPKAVVISEGLWRQSLAADPAIVGRTLRVNGHTRTVIGVMPRSFRFPESSGQDIEKGLWLPMQPTSEMLQERGADFFTILAKRQPGSSVAQVQAELGVIAKSIRDNDSRADRKLAFHAQSYHEMITGPVRQVFLALVAALALVLLIVCANIANVLIARGLGRQHEFAVRVLRTGSRSLGRRSLSTTACISLAGGEVALSVLLLVAAGLLFRTLWDLEHAHLGFEAANVTSFVAMPADAVGFGNSSSSTSAQTSVATTTYYPLLESLRHAPGVQGAALVTSPPFSGFVLQTNFRVIGWPRHTQSTFPARLVAISGGHHRL